MAILGSTAVDGAAACGLEAGDEGKEVAEVMIGRSLEAVARGGRWRKGIDQRAVAGGEQSGKTRTIRSAGKPL